MLAETTETSESSELARQLTLLVRQEDYESVKYLLSSDTPVHQLLPHMAPDVVVVLLRLRDEVKREEDVMDEEPNVDRNALIDAVLEPVKEEEDDLLMDREDPIFEVDNNQEPILDIIRRIHMTHGDTQPLQATLQATKRQLELLLAHIFSSEAMASIRMMHPHQRLDSAMKRYLTFLFPSYVSCFVRFNTAYRAIRSQTARTFSQHPNDYDENDQTMKQVDVRADETLKIEEKEFLVRCSEAVSISEWRRYNHNRSYTFLHYGLKPFLEWIGLPQDVAAHFVHLRDFCDMLSFVCLRLVRTMLFNANRRRHSNDLLLLITPFQPDEIIVYGNEMLPACEDKIRRFFIPTEPAEKQAHMLFLKECQTHSYKDFIPSKYFAEAERNELPVAEYVWQHSKEYRTLWTQRVKVERYLMEGGEKPQNEYVGYAEDRKKYWEADRGKVWKDYIMCRFGFKTGIKIAQKRVKLESLKD